jgi:hypothetical protein
MLPFFLMSLPIPGSFLNTSLVEMMREFLEYCAICLVVTLKIFKSWFGMLGGLRSSYHDNVKLLLHPNIFLKVIVSRNFPLKKMKC